MNFMNFMYFLAALARVNLLEFLHTHCTQLTRYLTDHDNIRDHRLKMNTNKTADMAWYETTA